MSSDGDAAGQTVNCVRVYTDAENVTRFEDITIDFAPAVYAPPAPPVSVSEAFGASAVVFVRVPAGWRDDAHPAPARQFVMILSGELEGTAGDETRRFKAGDIALTEDTSGPGHGVVAVTDVLFAIVRL